MDRKIIAVDNPFTVDETHFVEAKFYLKKYSTKVDDFLVTKNMEFLNKKDNVVSGQAKVASKKDLKLADTNTMPDVNVVKKRKMPVIYYVPKDNKDEGHPLKRQGNSLERPTHPIKQIDTIKSSAKLFGKFVAPASLESDTFPTIRSDKCFNPNTYKVLAKVGYDPNETSKLGRFYQSLLRGKNVKVWDINNLHLAFS